MKRRCFSRTPSSQFTGITSVTLGALKGKSSMVFERGVDNNKPKNEVVSEAMAMPSRRMNSANCSLPPGDSPRRARRSSV